MTSEEQNIFNKKAVNKWDKMLKCRGKKLALVAGVFTVMFILYRMSSNETELSTDVNRYSAMNAANLKHVSEMEHGWAHEQSEVSKGPKVPNSVVKTKNSKQSSSKQAFGQGNV